jgi:uncharacterized membrane protein
MREGLFLTWPMVGTIVVSVFLLGGIVFRYVYMKKKEQWLGLLKAAVAATPVSFRHGNNYLTTTIWRASSSNSRNLKPFH